MLSQTIAKADAFEDDCCMRTKTEDSYRQARVRVVQREGLTRTNSAAQTDHLRVQRETSKTRDTKYKPSERV
jgi:hypothetical protein